MSGHYFLSFFHFLERYTCTYFYSDVGRTTCQGHTELYYTALLSRYIYRVMARSERINGPDLLVLNNLGKEQLSGPRGT